MRLAGAGVADLFFARGLVREAMEPEQEEGGGDQAADHYGPCEKILAGSEFMDQVAEHRALFDEAWQVIRL